MNGLPETGGLYAFQAGFAARLRDPAGASLPGGVPERRMRAYEELVFNNLQGFLNACFPISRQILGEVDWDRAARSFFRDHRCVSPLFRDVPREFLDWLEGRADRLFPGRPFLWAFMHYEWLELAVSIGAEEEEGPGEPGGDPLTGRSLVNPTARLACYPFPVHRIGPDFQPERADGQLYCYLLYRDPKGRVRFMRLNPASARLIELLQQGGMTGREALLQLAGETSPADVEAFVAAGRGQLESLREAGVVLGIRAG